MGSIRISVARLRSSRIARKIPPKIRRKTVFGFQVHRLCYRHPNSSTGKMYSISIFVPGPQSTDIVPDVVMPVIMKCVNNPTEFYSSHDYFKTGYCGTIKLWATSR
ncbi:hypothetical protein Y032_0010g1008 [Ancylostoma ceylanicum]|uniref:Uncharacterized protein n=1 Tax=Ancylostoma ceylanicum TaxID=53326 RepID=A0A016VEY2_9BILA|nr:hypothetical protein Y032_0010g1008 [Ancylostoma ceylanicum]